MDNFEIKYCNSGVIISKDGASFSVEKGPDGDIWFSSLDSNTELPISYYSRNHDEWQNFIVFEYLMKSIIGKYILDGDDKDDFSSLPKDFIDLESKSITWHSDSDLDNILKLQLREKELVVSIIRNKNSNNGNSTKVRIRTSGSSYEYYYKEFERFFDELSRFAYAIDPNQSQETKPPTKKLSIFNRFKNN